MADHDLKTEIKDGRRFGGPKTVPEWYEDPQEYGAAMSAFAEYIGSSGTSLSEHIL